MSRVNPCCRLHFKRMYMKRIVLASLVFVLSLVASAQRTKYNFNPEWRVFVGDAKEAAAPSFNDAAWKKVTLPYAWNEDEAFKKDIVDHPTGIAWYRKRFKLPA